MLFEQGQEFGVELNHMKKQDLKKKHVTMNLGHLIATVSSVSKNNQETVATVADLLSSGRVLVETNGERRKALVVK